MTTRLLPSAKSLRVAILVSAAILTAAGPGVAAPNPQRLAEAAKSRDFQTVRTLLAQGVDVNVPLPGGAMALHWAAHWDEQDTTARLIRAGARVNVADDQGSTPLFLACANGSTAVANLLLQAGANAAAPRNTGATPLMMASRSGNLELVKALLAHGADVNARERTHLQTALMWAVAQNHVGVARVLIESGADVRARTPARSTQSAGSAQFGGGECCLPNYVGGFTPLLFAVQQGHIDAVKALLQAGADMNDIAADGSSALVLAIDSAPVVSERVARSALASHGLQEATARFLLEQGADPNLHGAGRSALHSAIQRKMPELVGLLLGRGADPNARLERRMPSVSRDVGIQNGMDVNMVGATPFWLAAGYGDVVSMRSLLAGGADPTIVTADHTTPLMVSAGIDFVDGQDKYGVRTFDVDISHLVNRAREAMTLCLDLGLDVNAANDKGQTALFGAVYMGSPELVQLLADRGANLDAANTRGQTPWSVAALGEYRAGSFFVKKEAADRLEKLGAKTTIAAAPGDNNASRRGR